MRDPGGLGRARGQLRARTPAGSVKAPAPVCRGCSCDPEMRCLPGALRALSVVWVRAVCVCVAMSGGQAFGVRSGPGQSERSRPAPLDWLAALHVLMLHFALWSDCPVRAFAHAVGRVVDFDRVRGEHKK